jgi:GntR family transcriptional repressor for pyruvate dehydrogenase complex
MALTGRPFTGIRITLDRHRNEDGNLFLARIEMVTDVKGYGSQRAFSFRPITGPRAFEEVIDQITHAVRSGAFPPGSRLPRINDLSREMRVSRPSVVEAVRVLSDAGVITIRRGAAGGITVASSVVPPAILRLSTTGHRARGLSEIIEARRPIEMQLALLAARRATQEDIADMRRAVSLLESAEPNSSEWTYAAGLFHYQVARAARSELLASYQHELLEDLYVLLGYPSPSFDPETEIHGHRITLAALETHDEEAVRQAMDAHLATFERTALKLERRIRPRIRLG